MNLQEIISFLWSEAMKKPNIEMPFVDPQPCTVHDLFIYRDQEELSVREHDIEEERTYRP